MLSTHVMCYAYLGIPVVQILASLSLTWCTITYCICAIFLAYSPTVATINFAIAVFTIFVACRAGRCTPSNIDCRYLTSAVTCCGQRWS